MNFTRDGLGFFSNAGHALLLCALVVQTAALARWGEKPMPRFFLSLAAPAAYALKESIEGLSFLFDMSHAFFWFFTISTAALQAASRGNASRRIRMSFEFLITILNVAAFFTVYVYFDLRLTAEAGGLSDAALRDTMSVFKAGNEFAHFLSDPTHIYMLAGGLFLAVILAVGRIKILSLKERINELFGQYVDPAFRDEIVQGNGGKPRERELCVLFADIRDFTTLSEREAPARVSGMLNAYFTEWEETVTRYGGTVDKYIGDAVMAIFGAAGGEPCDAAVSCALEMIHRLPRLKNRLAEAGLPAPEEIGVGIDYGKVIMGDLGSKRRKNFTVIGDHVNTASRMEALCKEMRRRCVLSETVFARLGEANAGRFEPLGETLVKGKSESVRVWGLKA
ncbi:MAG: adenylate/guanylate cyclase domain-containing protein [Treponemataceae bacterium]